MEAVKSMIYKVQELQKAIYGIARIVNAHIVNAAMSCGQSVNHI